jgi:hypothetical protein
MRDIVGTLSLPASDKATSPAPTIVVSEATDTEAFDKEGKMVKADTMDVESQDEGKVPPTLIQRLLGFFVIQRILSFFRLAQVS